MLSQLTVAKANSSISTMYCAIYSGWCLYTVGKAFQLSLSLQTNVHLMDRTIMTMEKENENEYVHTLIKTTFWKNIYILSNVLNFISLLLKHLHYPSVIYTKYI